MIMEGAMRDSVMLEGIKARVVGRDSRQSETNVQCEHFHTYTHPPLQTAMCTFI